MKILRGSFDRQLSFILKRKSLLLLSTVCSTFFFCEFLIYYLVIGKCTWPEINDSSPSEEKLRMMLLADTHLLGVRNGHWFDKLRREWQMYRAFQTANHIFAPEVIFFLGDLFDEGQWASTAEFDRYLERFRRLFYVGESQQVFTVAGNHDIGFHYAISPITLNRFERKLKRKLVELVSVKGILFVLINSMAMEGDGCRMCHEADDALLHINHTLTCLQTRSETGKIDCGGISGQYIRPILMQHFPLFRHSDSNCSEPDEAPSFSEKQLQMRQKYDCLSAESTDRLLTQLRPRAAFDGHSHNGCTLWKVIGDSKDDREEKLGFWEWTISSFSWRNRNNPAFLLATVTQNDIQVTNFAALTLSHIAALKTSTSCLMTCALVLLGSVALCVFQVDY